MKPEIVNTTRSFAGNRPDENCTERTVILDDNTNDAEATAPEVGDENDTGALGDKVQPDPDRVMSNLPVLGIGSSGTSATVIVTCGWEAKTLDKETDGDAGPRFGTTATRVPMELDPIVKPSSLTVAAWTADEAA